MSAPYKVDSIEGGVRNLNDLIDMICDLRFNISAGEDDTRIDSLLWIARDLAQGVTELVERRVSK